MIGYDLVKKYNKIIIEDNKEYKNLSDKIFNLSRKRSKLSKEYKKITDELKITEEKMRRFKNVYKMSTM